MWPPGRARVRLSYAGQDYHLDPGESVLDGLARHGVRIPSACRAGACQACLLKADTGDPGAASQRGLKPTLAARGYFLACQARPASDLAVRSGRDAATPATLVATRWLSHDVLAVWLRPRRPVSFRAGQHTTLDRGDGVIRAYSIANRPAEAARDGLEFHVRVYPGGAMSGWLATAAPGARLAIGVPAGECFYTPGAPAAPLLLAGTGTGIAPLLAIARDAVAHGHSGPLIVFHGAAEPGRLYLGTPLVEPSPAQPGRGKRDRLHPVGGQPLVAVGNDGHDSLQPKSSAWTWLAGTPMAVRRPTVASTIGVGPAT